MSNNYIPTQKEINRAQADAKNANILEYVKTMMMLGVVFAIIVFLKVGAGYDEQYGFAGSTGAAFSAAIGVVMIFALLGALIGWVVKQFKCNYAKKLVADAAKAAERFANNPRIQSIIAQLTNDFTERIVSAKRPNYEKEINESAIITVYATRISYGKKELNLQTERLAELTTQEERLAMAQAIAEGVCANIKNQFSNGLTEDIPCVTTTYNQTLIETCVTAIVKYCRANENYQEPTPW